jgi:serine protease Do
MRKFAVFSVLGLLVSQAYASSTVESEIFVNLAKKIVPSVVNISTLSTVKSPYGGGGPDDLFRKFFEDFFRRHGGGGGDEDDGGDTAPPPRPGPGPSGKAPKAMSLGTGFIIEPGLILTNNHVVQDADEIKIYFTEATDEKAADGEVAGRDTELDIAIIRVKTKREMVPVVLGDSEAVEVGEYVMAVGNPFGQGHSVTHGIISAKGRPAPDFPLATYLQTDAPINPGNSGGPLVNLKGEVIGINNAIDQRAQGIGFAIPISLVKKVLPQLRSKGTVARGYIGVLVNEMAPDLAPKLGADKDLKAPFVTHVYPGEPADKAGVKPYDVILEFAGHPIHTSGELIAAVTAVEVGQAVPLKVLRSGKEKTLQLTVAQRPGTNQIAAKPPGKEKGKPKKNRIETGMTLEEMTPDIARDLGVPEKTQGVVVSSTVYGGPADRQGILRGDIILEVDRKPVKDVDAFYSIVKDKKSYLLRVRRTDPQGREVFSVVILDLKDTGDSKE